MYFYEKNLYVNINGEMAFLRPVGHTAFSKPLEEKTETIESFSTFDELYQYGTLEDALFTKSSTHSKFLFWGEKKSVQIGSLFTGNVYTITKKSFDKYNLKISYVIVYDKYKPTLKSLYEDVPNEIAIQHFKDCGMILDLETITKIKNN